MNNSWVNELLFCTDYRLLRNQHHFLAYLDLSWSSESHCTNSLTTILVSASSCVNSLRWPCWVYTGHILITSSKGQVQSQKLSLNRLYEQVTATDSSQSPLQLSWKWLLLLNTAAHGKICPLSTCPFDDVIGIWPVRLSNAISEKRFDAKTSRCKDGGQAVAYLLHWGFRRPAKVQVGQEVMLIGVKLQLLASVVCSLCRRATH